MNKARPLPELLKLNRNAATVYMALRWIAGERRQLNITRDKIRAVCGLHIRRISEAMAALDECGWVVVNYGRHGIKTWYRLSFPVGQIFPVCMKTAHRERKVSDKKSTQGTVRCVYENDPQSLKRLGECPASSGGHVATTTESPAARIERERMAQIQAQRINGKV